MRDPLEATIVGQVVRQLTEFAGAHPDLVARLRSVEERERTQRFHIAVVGEFKRGKSTLLNALLGRTVVPTGVLPLTSVATEVRYGAGTATAVGLDGSETQIDVSEVADYVTEAGNPDNVRGVERVVIEVDAPLLQRGLVLVDTPGIGSIHAHNTEAALAEYQRIDAAIVVLAADTPLSEGERAILDQLRSKNMRTFVVVNRCDHLRADDLAEVGAFIRSQVDAPLWMVSARAALSRRASSGERDDPGEFDDFARAIGAFVDQDLAAARAVATRDQLDHIAAELVDRLQLELSAASLGAETAMSRADAFERAAEVERDSFVGDRLVLDQRVDQLCASVGEHLADMVADAFERRAPELRGAANVLPLAGLEDRLGILTESIVAEETDRALETSSTIVQQGWSELAAWYRSRLDARVAAVRGIAADLFEVPLISTSARTAEVARAQVRLNFHHEASVTEPVDHLVRSLLPPPIRRRRAITAATNRLHRLLDRKQGGSAWRSWRSFNGSDASMPRPRRWS
jgi:small GTP-binding protein